MITSRIQIEGDKKIYDTESLFGFVQIESDNIFGAPIKAFEKTTYPEQSGEHIYPISVADAFDYKVKFFISAKGGLETANWKIEEFNSSICTEVEGTKTFKRISFYNDYKGVKIVGIPSPISQATEFWRDKSGKQHEVVCVELVIRVDKPNLCNFNLANEEYEVFVVKQEVFYVKKNKVWHI